MRCFCNIDYGLIVAVFALVAALASIRYQIISLIQTQLADKARECNRYLDNNSQIPVQADKVSGIVSSARTAKELLHYQLVFKRYYILAFLNKQGLIDQFYLQLHTSIRQWIEKDSLPANEIETIHSDDPSIQAANNQIKQTIASQFLRMKDFLARSIKKNQSGFFDKL
jgi:hypothetical protein